jgi:hypothetical protein
MLPLLCGGLGGIVPLIAVLVVSEGEPLASYISNLAVSGVEQKFIGYMIKVVCLFGLGVLWVRLNNEQNELRAFQLGIAAPAIITGMIATYDAKTRAHSVSIEFIRPAYADINGPLRIHQAQVIGIIGGILNEPIVEDLPIERLPDRFTGNDRRLASDRLIELYPQNKQQAVNAVIQAIRPPERRDSYRVNIYVARTLGLIPGGWEGSEEQKQAIERLRSHGSYQRDPTFKENVDRALANWKPR